MFEIISEGDLRRGKHSERERETFVVSVNIHYKCGTGTVTKSTQEQKTRKMTKINHITRMFVFQRSLQ